MENKEIEVALYDHDHDDEDRGIATDVWLAIDGDAVVLTVDDARWLGGELLEAAGYISRREAVEEECARLEAGVGDRGNRVSGAVPNRIIGPTETAGRRANAPGPEPRR